MKYVFAGILFIVASLSASAQDTQSRFNARIGAQIGDLVIQNDNLAVLVDTLQSQLASAQQRIRDFEAKLVEAQQRIKDLEAELAGPKQSEDAK